MDYFIYLLIFLLVFNTVWFVGLVVYVIKLFYEIRRFRINHDYYSNRQVRALQNGFMVVYKEVEKQKNGNDTL